MDKETKKAELIFSLKIKMLIKPVNIGYVTKNIRPEAIPISCIDLKKEYQCKASITEETRNEIMSCLSKRRGSFVMKLIRNRLMTAKNNLP